MFLPDRAGPERETAILDAVLSGRHRELTWHPVVSEARGRRAKFWVSGDALTIDDVRVNVNAVTAQRIADHLGAVLDTSRTADLAWEQASVQLKPCLMPADASMATAAAMVEHSRRVDAQLAGRSGLVRTVGKGWIVHPRMSPTVAVNYGWHDPKAPHLSWSGLHMWQTVGTRHNPQYTDYSQTLTLVRREVEVDGETRDAEDVLRSPELSWLLSDDGSLTTTRYAVPGNKIPKEPTPIDPLSLAAVLRDGHHAIVGEFPSANRLGVAWSQNMLEHARGNAVWCHNLGNVSAFGAWPGDYYVIRVKEQLQPGVWKDVDMRFRAHADFVDGARDYWRIITGRYAPALPAFDAGDARAAAHDLHALGYFTANEAPYATGTAGLLSEFWSRIEARL
jgi:hypothetical protein